MHFDIKGVELEIVEKTAIEDTLHLDGALKKLLYLGRDITRDEALDLQIRTQAIEGVLERLEIISNKTEELYSEVETTTSDVREML